MLTVNIAPLISLDFCLIKWEMESCPLCFFLLYLLVTLPESFDFGEMFVLWLA
jgi:hypothetical protein